MPAWTAPPTRRELLLLLVSVTIFICAYNADTTLNLFGYSARPYSPFASTRPPPIGPDGRRPDGYRDALEDEIFGTWDWEPGRIAGVKQAESGRVIGGHVEGDQYIHGDGVTGKQAMWLQGVSEGKYAVDSRLGNTTVNDESVHWGENVPRTKVLFHKPGFTILDDVIMASGTFFLVTDDPTSMPTVTEIASSSLDHELPPRGIDWQVLAGSNAVSKFGHFAGRMHGATLVSYDAFVDGHTLLSLQRLYSNLSLDSPPLRILFPTIPTFSEPLVDFENDALLRRRSGVGIHPATLKAAYPSLAGPHFSEDFDDFSKLDSPVLLSRVVVVDRGASARAGMRDTPWARIFLDGRKDWFESVRHTLRDFFDVEEVHARGKEITYLSRQTEGPSMSAAEHEKLVSELRKLGAVVHVVEETTPWKDRMNAIVRSTVVIGATGDHLSDCAFITPGPHAALVELFPDGAFNHDWEIVMKSMGHGYVAFQGTQKLGLDSSTAPSRPSRLGDLKIDPSAVARAVHDFLARH